MKEEFFTHILPNGLKIIHYPTASRVSYLGVMIQTGTYEENDNNNGIAHFVEHMLMKGTENRSAKEIIHTVEDIGGEINAYTSKEETFVYCSFLTGYHRRIVELLADITLHSVFNPQETERERSVILNEIDTYKDSPAEQIYDDFEAMVFANHPLGNRILGEEKKLKKVATADLAAFYKRYYVPDNMVLASVGNISPEELFSLATEFFGVVARGQVKIARTPFSAFSPHTVATKKDNHQVHCLIGGKAYPIHHSSKTALIVLNNLLGGNMMSARLNMSLREKEGLLYYIESGYTPFQENGIFSVYFGSSAANSARCIEKIMNEFRLLRSQPISEQELEVGKRQIIAQMVVVNESHEDLLHTLCRTYLYFDKVLTLDESIGKIEKVTTTQIREVANETLSETNLYSLMWEI